MLAGTAPPTLNLDEDAANPPTRPAARPIARANHDAIVTLTRLATKAAHAIVLAFGWRRALIAFVAGALSALALAPFNAWPMMFITIPVLVWLVDGSTAGRWSGAWTAAIAGWCFGFGYFVAGLYWVGYAFLVDAKTFGWLLPVAVAGLPAYLAIYTGLGLAAARLIWVRGPRTHSGARHDDDHRRMAARSSADRFSLEHIRLCADRSLWRWRKASR